MKTRPNDAKVAALEAANRRYQKAAEKRAIARKAYDGAEEECRKATSTLFWALEDLNCDRVRSE